VLLQTSIITSATVGARQNSTTRPSPTRDDHSAMHTVPWQTIQICALISHFTLLRLYQEKACLFLYLAFVITPLIVMVTLSDFRCLPFSKLLRFIWWSDCIFTTITAMHCFQYSVYHCISPELRINQWRMWTKMLGHLSALYFRMQFLMNRRGVRWKSFARINTLLKVRKITFH
jgi:hypothetical protein